MQILEGVGPWCCYSLHIYFGIASRLLRTKGTQSLCRLRVCYQTIYNMQKLINKNLHFPHCRIVLAFLHWFLFPQTLDKFSFVKIYFFPKNIGCLFLSRFILPRTLSSFTRQLIVLNFVRTNGISNKMYIKKQMSEFAITSVSSFKRLYQCRTKMPHNCMYLLSK